MIKGITPSLSEAGKIKIGYAGDERTSKKTGNVYRLPVKLDHFIITTKERERDKEGNEIKNSNFILDEELMDLIANGKKKITEIPIVLHSDKIDDVFPTAYNMYIGRRITCKGDGEKACSWEIGADGKRTGRTKEVKCTCKYLGATKGKICKPNGTLHCSIATPGRAVAGAVHKWRTASIISIQRMIGSLEQIKSVCGTLRGIPLWLKLDPVKVEMGEVYCCHVELRAKDLLDVQRKALELASMRAALGGKEFPRGLISVPGNDDESYEEQADVQEEFYPDVIEGETDDVPDEFEEGISKFSTKNTELWGFSNAKYEESPSTNETPPQNKKGERPIRDEKKKAVG